MTLGKKTTAEEALRGASLAGKTVIVTGANAGLGVETARVLKAAGADVLRAVRTVTEPDMRALDLADLDSVRHFAEGFLAEGRPLHILVNNAGVMATPLGQTKQHIELQLGTNHVGHFLLTNLLRPALEKGGTSASPARVVTVSSSLHRRGRGARLLETLETDRTYTRRKYVPFDAYGDSKLANVLFARRLAKLLPPTVLAFSLHPGVIPTQLTRSMGLAGAVFRTFSGPFTKTIQEGAATSVYAATAPEIASQSGAYLSDCAVARASRDGSDDKLAEEVWAATERFVASV